MTHKWKGRIFIFIIFVLIACFAVFLIFGCAMTKAKVPVLMSDNTIQVIEFEYIRWWNQSIGSFSMITPTGWEVFLEKQNAANSASFKVGPYEITIGGGADAPNP